MSSLVLFLLEFVKKIEVLLEKIITHIEILVLF